MSEQAEKKGFLNLIWVRDALIILILLTIALKIALTDFKVDLTGFSFTDLLALLMALFSILLSALFYFKSSDDSTKFHNNTYIFTKEISELLGRIEAGFGEKLSNLQENYAGLSGRFDRLPLNPAELRIVNDQQDVVAKIEEEKKKLLEDFANKFQIAEDEKNEFLAKLEQTTSELENAKNQLANLQAPLNDPNNHDPARGIARLINMHVGKVPLKELSFPGIQRYFNGIYPLMKDSVVKELKSSGHLSKDGELSSTMLMRIASHIQKEF